MAVTLIAPWLVLALWMGSQGAARSQQREHVDVRRWVLQQGEAIQYVQRMLGHASIALTVDTYGKWLPMGNKAAVDRFDERSFINGGGKLVAGATKASKATAASC